MASRDTFHWTVGGTIAGIFGAIVAFAALLLAVQFHDEDALSASAQIERLAEIVATARAAPAPPAEIANAVAVQPSQSPPAYTAAPEAVSIKTRQAESPPSGPTASPKRSPSLPLSSSSTELERQASAGTSNGQPPQTQRPELEWVYEAK